MADKKDDWMMWLLGGGAFLAVLTLLGLNKGGNDDKFSGHWHDQDGGHGGGFGVGHAGGHPHDKKPGCGPCSLGK